MVLNFSKDYNKGKADELEVLPILQKYFDDESITICSNPYSQFDYVSQQNRCIELKSRNCKSSNYSTTMIGVNKLYNLDANIDYYFCFKFTDGIYLIKYNQNFGKYETRIAGRSDRGTDERKMYLYQQLIYLESIKK